MVLRDSVGRSAGTGALLRRLARSVRASARYFSAAERRVVAAKGRIRRRFRRTETRPRIKVCGCRCGWRTSTRSTGSASGGDRSDASADGHAVERAGDACAASGWPRISCGQGTWGALGFTLSAYDGVRQVLRGSWFERRLWMGSTAQESEQLKRDTSECGPRCGLSVFCSYLLHVMGVSGSYCIW